MAIFHTTDEPANREDNTALAVAWACKMAIQNGTRQVLIYVVSLANYGSILENSLGSSLKKDRHIIIEGVDVYLEASQSKATYFHQGPVVLPFSTVDLVREWSRSPKATDIVFLPWMSDEYKEYLLEFPSSQEIPFADTLFDLDFSKNKPTPSKMEKPTTH